MIEPLFRSSSPLWTGIPSPTFGWFQAQPPPSGVRSTSVLPGFASSSPLTQTTMPQGFAPPGSVVAEEAYAYGVPLNALAFAGAPVATAPALLAAVAMKRGQPSGPTNDQEIEDFLYDALELVTGTNDVEVRCDSGRVTLTGSVPHKRVKRDVGEIAWAIPTINDVQNNVSIATRRRARPAGREVEQHPGAASRKQA